MKVLTDEKIGTLTPKYNAKYILVFFSNCLDQSLDPKQAISEENFHPPYTNNYWFKCRSYTYFNWHDGMLPWPAGANRTGGLMVREVSSSVIDCVFEPRSGQTKDYKIGICCFPDKHATLRRKSKDWLYWNWSNVSEWADMSIRGLLFRWTSTIKIQFSVLV